MDDRTGSRRITGASLKELKPRNGTNGKGPVELSLWMARHGLKELEEIHAILTAHPGSTPVLLHVKSGNGRRATIECGKKFRVMRCPALERALAEWS